MATYKLTEYYDAPIRHGNQQPIAQLPWLRIRKIDTTVDANVQIHADAKYIEIGEASADIYYKVGAAQGDVTGGNVPADANAQLFAAGDPLRGFGVSRNHYFAASAA